MERVSSDVEGLQRSFTDLDAFLVDPRVEGTFDLEPGRGCGCRDELDDGGSIRKRPAAPVLRDPAEQAMLYLIPFRRARRIMPDLYGQARLVREFL